MTDFHIHIIPVSIAEGFRSNAQADGLPDAAIEITVFPTACATAAHTARELHSAGFDRAVIQGLPLKTEPLCRVQNDSALRAMKEFPDVFTGFCAVNPRMGKAAITEARRCLDSGMTGVGELCPAAQGFGLDDPCFLALCDLCAEADKPVSLRVKAPIVSFGKTDAVPLKSFLELARSKPELKIILSNFGGGLVFYELMNEVRRVMRKVCYDTASVEPLSLTAALPPAMRALSGEKLLFGSGFPLTKISLSDCVDAIKKALPEQPLREKLLQKNAEQLLDGGKEALS